MMNLLAPASRLVHSMVLAFSMAGMLGLAACGSAAVGSATLNWSPPTENEDGSVLDDLAGYRVYWRQYGSAERHMIEIREPSVTSFEIENLPEGNWRAGVTAFTEDARESDVATVAFTIRRGQISVDESTLGRFMSRTEFHAGQPDGSALIRTVGTPDERLISD
jgi:hypothetical protein